MVIKNKNSKYNEIINFDHIAICKISNHADNILFFKSFKGKTIASIIFKGKQETLNALELLEKAIINGAPYLEI